MTGDEIRALLSRVMRELTEDASMARNADQQAAYQSYLRQMMQAASNLSKLIPPEPEALQEGSVLVQTADLDDIRDQVIAKLMRGCEP